MTRPRRIRPGTMRASGVLAATLLLAGCATPAPYSSATAQDLQQRVLAVSEAAAATDYPGTRMRSDELRVAADDALARGDISAERHSAIMSALDLVQADVDAVLAEEARVEDEARAAEEARLADEAQAAEDARLADEAEAAEERAAEEKAAEEEAAGEAEEAARLAEEEAEADRLAEEQDGDSNNGRDKDRKPDPSDGQDSDDERDSDD